MWSISNLFPNWGDTGTKPPEGTDREGGDQISDEEYDYLWYALNELEDEVRSALTDIDSNQDGAVDEADAGVDGFTLLGSTILGGDVTDGSGNTLWNDAAKYVPVDSLQQGDGSGLDADSVDGVEPPFSTNVSDDGTEVVPSVTDINFGSNIAVSDDGDGTVTITSDDDATTYKGNDIDSDGDGVVDQANDADTVDGKDASELGFDPPSPSDVTGSRSLGTTYTNNNSIPIIVYITISGGVGSIVQSQASIDGLTVQNIKSQVDNQESRHSFSIVVPSGSTYEVNISNGSLSKWIES